MKLSLVSWYSEPGAEDPNRAMFTSSSSSCCDAGGENRGRQTISLTESLLIGKISGGNANDKENTSQSTSPLKNNLQPLDSDLGGSRESIKTLQEEENKPSNESVQPKTQNHVTLVENKQNFKKKVYPCFSNENLRISTSGGKPECSKCSRRSKSGHSSSSSSTPINSHQFRSGNRTSTTASRRLILSTKSSTELKKPIKSILKCDSHSRSGSGSDNKSSMDSLADPSRCGNNLPTPQRPGQVVQIMSRSAESTRAKFNLNSATEASASTSHSSTEQIVSRLRRIEKYATLRFRKTRNQIQPLNLGSDSELHNNNNNNIIKNGGAKGGKHINYNMDPMTKSMSFLEKGEIGDHSSLPFAPNNNTTTCLKRQGSLRLKKGVSPQWEPCTTRTTALRMQKMQETKAKKGGGGGSATTVSGGSGSAHSGSGESINHNHHSTTTPTNKTISSGKSTDKSKVFAKLSSAVGQTASSNQKRLKQEKSVQTDVPQLQHDTAFFSSGNNASSMSPIPSVDGTIDLLEQIKGLEKLANRYRNTALRFQYEYEKSEAKNIELRESQTESSEMIDFLQTEKSTLAESLAELEIEAKKWRDEISSVKKESDSRISSLVQINIQQKQEFDNSQSLLHRLESQSNDLVTSISNQISEGTNAIVLSREKVNALTESLIKAYKIPQELIASFADANTQTIEFDDSTKPNSSLLLPLINLFAKTFPTSASTMMLKSNKDCQSPKSKTTSVTIKKPNEVGASGDTDEHLAQTQTNSTNNVDKTIAETVEDIGLDQITLPQLVSFPEEDNACEIEGLNNAITRLLLVVRVIVVQCDKRVSNVASSILECLHAAEDEKTHKIVPDQKSFPGSTTHHNGNSNSSLHDKDS